MNMNMEYVSREVRNVSNRMTEGLVTTAYEILMKTDTYDICRYGGVTIAETTMMPNDTTEGEYALAIGCSFNTFASYLLGSNANQTSMKMTSPVMVNKS